MPLPSTEIALQVQHKHSLRRIFVFYLLLFAGLSPQEASMPQLKKAISRALKSFKILAYQRFALAAF